MEQFQTVKSAVSAARPREASRIGYPFFKRSLDVVVVGTLLILGMPLLGLIALLVWTQDRGPVFFWQWRVGQDGRRFRFYKFRSMVVDAEARKGELAAANEADGPIFKMRDDPRITPLGRVLRRYSLDELPQLWCVLKGDMSLVGPRPHLPAEIDAYTGYPKERLSVPPGMVCLREVSGRSHLCFEQWLASDLDYVRRRSLALDLFILLRVLPAVLRADGAY